MVRLKVISLHIYKDLRHESHDNHHEDGHLVPSHRCDFSFVAA